MLIAADFRSIEYHRVNRYMFPARLCLVCEFFERLTTVSLSHCFQYKRSWDQTVDVSCRRIVGCAQERTTWSIWSIDSPQPRRRSRDRTQQETGPAGHQQQGDPDFFLGQLSISALVGSIREPEASTPFPSHCQIGNYVRLFLCERFIITPSFFLLKQWINSSFSLIPFCITKPNEPFESFSTWHLRSWSAEDGSTWRIGVSWHALPRCFFEWPRDKNACTQKKEEPFEGHCGYTHVIYLYIYVINHAARTWWYRMIL